MRLSRPCPSIAAVLAVAVAAAAAQTRTNSGAPTGRATTAPSTTYSPTNHQPSGRTGTAPAAPSGSDAGTWVGVGIGLALAGLGTYELAQHHGEHGPDLPKSFDMNGFAIKGLARANWPVVFDFMTETPGNVLVDIKSKAHEVQYTLPSPTPGVRRYRIFYLPDTFDPDPASALYTFRFVPDNPAAASAALRAYGLGAGFKSVGSVSIDELSFQPASVSKRLKDVADYGFHAHSAFDGVQANFVSTRLVNGHILIQRDQQQSDPPIAEGELAHHTWQAKGHDGDHMLEVKAWRGLPNGGDWVVAWSPDIVTLTP